jgi:hypothetical protein
VRLRREGGRDLVEFLASSSVGVGDPLAENMPGLESDLEAVSLL